MSRDTPLPRSIAIAGGWGYIGQRFIRAAIGLGLDVHVFDPGPCPPGMAGLPIHKVEDEDLFYGLDAGVFHLALHPTHRRRALELLLGRSDSGRGPLILCEKPMADPSCPEDGMELMRSVRESRARLLFDFLELFDPMTVQVVRFLRRFRNVRIVEARLHRSKDRENPGNPRNYKIMVPIQYQETVHCIAYVLHLAAHSTIGLDKALANGVTASGVAEPYCPPNPEAYPRPVDGKVDGTLELGNITVHLHTNFKAGAEFTKRRVIKGIGDGQEFTIEADYFEGAKYLRINGEEQAVDNASDSPAHAIRQAWAWRQSADQTTLALSQRYPNADFAWHTYVLSAMLWDSCANHAPARVTSHSDLLRYRAR